MKIATRDPRSASSKQEIKCYWKRKPAKRMSNAGVAMCEVADLSQEKLGYIKASD